MRDQGGGSRFISIQHPSCGPAPACVFFLAALLLLSTLPDPFIRAACAQPAQVPPPMEKAAPDSSERGLPPVFQPGNWDSVLAAYDASIKPERHGRISPEFDLHYTKVEGIHLEGGCSVAYPPLRVSHLEGRFGYDFERSRPAGLALLRVSLRGPEVVFLELSARSGVTPFGNCLPYGNTVMALVDGYDAREYLLRREVGAMVVWQVTPDRQVGLGWLRARDDPLPALSDWHMFGGDHWMDHNEQADHLVDHGIRLLFQRRPPYQGETVRTGLIVRAEATAFGGELLGGREFSRTIGDLWYTRPIRRHDAFHIRASSSVAAGRPPYQAWQDLGGAAGLKAFPPRGFGTPDTLIGLTRFFLRLEYQRNQQIFPRVRVRVIRNLMLKLVPFAEVGSVWGGHPVRPGGTGAVAAHGGAGGSTVRPVPGIVDWDDLRAPRRSEIRSDLGFGLRRDLDYAGLLSHIQLDFAWPLGAQTGPARITVLFSRNWLD